MSINYNLNSDQFISTDELRGLGSYDFPGHTMGSEGIRKAYDKDTDTYSRSTWRDHGGPEGYISHLANDIKANGMHTPIEVVHHRGKDVVYDGHHRSWAAMQAGVDSVPIRYTGVLREDRD